MAINKYVSISVSVLSLCVGGFFALGGQKTFAQISDCQIDAAGTHFRPGPIAVIDEYDDDPNTGRPFVYFDVKTIGCNSGNGHLLAFDFYTLVYDAQTQEFNETGPIQTETVYMAGAFTSINYPHRSSSPNFSLPIRLGEAGCAENELDNYPWYSYFGFSTYSIQSLVNDASVKDCMIFVKISKAVPVSTNPYPAPSTFTQIYPPIGESGLGLLYECDFDCNVPWISGGPSCFGSGAVPPDNIVEYQGTCPLDTSEISGVTIVNQNDQNAGADLGEYSDEALAPLPGFSGSNNLGEFLKALFTILIVIAGLLALIMIVWGGVTYMTSDAFSKKQDGKDYIINAVIGLLLALGAFIILNTINPDLTTNLHINIPTVSLSIGDADYWSSTAQTTAEGTLTSNQPLPNIGLQCPEGGGVGAVPGIIDSFLHKTTYRWGAKGGPLPSGGQFQLSPNEQSSGSPHMCQGPNGQVPCRSFCPDNSVCLDCSGFVNQVRRCAGLTQYGGTASMATAPPGIAVDMSNLSGDGQSISIGGTPYTFVPGDILVWNGHVVIYYGNGIIAESAGSLATNANIKKSPLSSYSGRNKITHLIKVNP